LYTNWSGQCGPTLARTISPAVRLFCNTGDMSIISGSIHGPKAR
jgi:hypothetical protein